MADVFRGDKTNSMVRLIYLEVNKLQMSYK